MLTRMWSNKICYSLLVGMQNSTATLEDHWLFLTKLSILFPYSLTIVLLSIYAKKVENLYPHKKLIPVLLINANNGSNQDVLPR